MKKPASNIDELHSLIMEIWEKNNISKYSLGDILWEQEKKRSRWSDILKEHRMVGGDVFLDKCDDEELILLLLRELCLVYLMLENKNITHGFVVTYETEGLPDILKTTVSTKQEALTIHPKFNVYANI